MRPTSYEHPRAGGKFFRGVKKSGASKRWPKDDDISPRAGRKLVKSFFSDIDDQGGCCVNCADCLPSPSCTSRLLSEGAANPFRYVLMIDLERLRSHGAIVAIHKPEPLPNGLVNECHFELVAEEDGVCAVSMLLKDIASQFEDTLVVRAPSEYNSQDFQKKLEEYHLHFCIVFEVGRNSCSSSNCSDSTFQLATK